jgi:hypothetical protein
MRLGATDRDNVRLLVRCIDTSPIAGLTMLKDQHGQDRASMMESQSNHLAVGRCVLSRDVSQYFHRYRKTVGSGELSPARPFERSLSALKQVSHEFADHPTTHRRSHCLASRG